MTKEKTHGPIRSVPTSPTAPFGVENSPVPVPMKTELIERITNEDKAMLEAAKLKQENALLNAKLALSQNETAQANYDNVVLRLALKYHLVDGNKILEDGAIERKV